MTACGIDHYRVHIYAHEYRVYGPDGLRIVFERNAQGAFIKRAVTLDEQGSIATVTDATGYSHAEIHDDHGERATVPQRRTGWLDRELDYETAPGHVRHKLYDLDHRKYDAATAQFLSVDPLWSMFISSGSYVYCTGDAINNVDPWGLGPDNPLAPTPKPKQSPKPKPSSPLGPPSPMVTGHGDSYENAGEWVFDIRYGLRLSMPGELGDGMGPQGNGPGVSVLTPPGGIGPGGKGGVGGINIPDNGMKTQRRWMDVAQNELAVAEFNPGDNPRILQYHAAVKSKFTSDAIPWCASFVSWCLQQVNVNEFSSPSAAAWIGFGSKLTSPEFGAIAVYQRVQRDGRIQNHVAFVAGVDSSGDIILLGGNQSDMVSLMRPRGGRFLYFGLPTGFIPTGYLPVIGNGITTGGSTR
jgi:uncharacterized protein (TIGR02594 family)